MVMLLLATLLTGCASRVLEVDNIEPLRVQAISTSAPEIIKLSGLVRHNALGISRVKTAQTGETLQVRVYAALVSDANPNGDLDVALEGSSLGRADCVRQQAVRHLDSATRFPANRRQSRKTPSETPFPDIRPGQFILTYRIMCTILSA
jgi:hypothetical protein